MRVIGVDEHVWRHTPYGDKYVTVVLDLTPIRDRRGPSRLLDMVPGRSKKVFKTWLASQPDTWRERIEIVAMDGFTGFKSAAAEELPDARAVMDPFHVVHLAGNALDECRRRIQQELHHRRGRATDPLYKARRMLHTRSCLLTARQQHQILDLFSSDEHVALEVTWSAYQNIIDAYRSSNARGGKTLMHEEITRLTSTSVPSSLTELTTLGRTLKRRAADILAYFDHPHTSNGPTEAINAPPRTPTRLRPRACETSATTSPEHSSKPEDSNPNYTPNYEEPDNGGVGVGQAQCRKARAGHEAWVGDADGGSREVVVAVVVVVDNSPAEGVVSCARVVVGAVGALCGKAAFEGFAHRFGQERPSDGVRRYESVRVECVDARWHPVACGELT